MQKILDMISVEIKNAFAKCGYSEEYGRVTVSNRPDLCEYQCNGAMAAAKAYGKKPFDIATEVTELLKTSESFEDVQCVMPGFINIKVSAGFLADYLTNMKKAEKYGVEAPEKIQTIVVDYGGANVAKPLHVGHLRPAIIGESVKRICKYAGHNVIGDAHLGDWGLPLGEVIEEIKDRMPELPFFDPDFKGEYPKECPCTIADLEEIYPYASSRVKTDAEFSKRCHEAVFKLQKGERGYRDLWKLIVDLSKEDLKKNYDNLNVSFELWNGESDADKYIDEMICDMEKKGVAHESQGAIVVDIAEPGDKKEFPPCIVRKSDGAVGYPATDLATLIDREIAYKPDSVIYVVDKRQELHFTQVFRTSRKAGIVRPETNLSFLGFGTMNGPDGKPFKTRDGGVLRLEKLISMMSDAVLAKINENREVSEKEALETAKIVGLAALKYGDLSNQATKDYCFDIDRFVSFEGNTGPYILYTIVRIKSIMAKYNDKFGADVKECTIRPAETQAEKNLMLKISAFAEMINSAFNDIAPHTVCRYVYELSDSFNAFYHETHILTEENKERREGWIALLSLTRGILETGIDLLGFSAPERM